MECKSLIHLEYGAFSDRLHANVGQERIPLNGSFEVTSRCNLRCVHCYLPLAQRGGSQQDELSLPEIRGIFSELADEGCLWLLLTGGEPFIRKDFLQIYDDAKHKGFITTIFTNGTLLTEQIADYLAEWPPFSTEISLYGATQSTYERVTGIPGSFTRCIRGIEMLLERSLPLKLKSVLLNVNHHELAAMKELSRHFGVDFRYDPVINAGIDGSLQPTEFRLSPEQILAIEMNDSERANLWVETLEKTRDFQVDPQRMYICNAGQKSFHIDASGKLSLCISARYPSYDLRQGGFQAGWNHFIGSLLELEHGPSFECSGCDLRAACLQCPAMGFAEFGDFGRRVPFLCELAHLRKGAFASINC